MPIKTPVFVLAALATIAGLGGWGTGWFLLFWLPLIAMLVLPLVIEAWRNRAHVRAHVTRVAKKPVPAIGADGGWELRFHGHQCQTPLPLVLQGRAYVTSTLISAAFIDSRKRFHRFTFTAGSLDPACHRQLRCDLRLASARQCHGR